MASNSNAVRVLMEREGLTFAQADHFLSTGEKASRNVAPSARREAEPFTDLAGGPSEDEEGAIRLNQDLQSLRGVGGGWDDSSDA